MYEDTGYGLSFWIKFSILTLVFCFLIWKMGSNLSFMWRTLFILCAPVGIYFALIGKSMKLHK